MLTLKPLTPHEATVGYELDADHVSAIEQIMEGTDVLCQKHILVTKLIVIVPANLHEFPGDAITAGANCRDILFAVMDAAAQLHMREVTISIGPAVIIKKYPYTPS
jgi:hypothetical protein